MSITLLWKPEPYLISVVDCDDPPKMHMGDMTQSLSTACLELIFTGLPSACIH